MSYEITEAAAETLTVLVGLGYKIRKFHTDDVIDVCKDINGERVGIFVRADGTYQRPRTDATMIATAELHGLDITASLP
jgi:hypothetical protein